MYFGSAPEERMNGVCAGGTGAFIDHMAALLNTDAKGLNDLAANARRIYTIASRCGVFAKTDIQADHRKPGPGPGNHRQRSLFRRAALFPAGAEKTFY